MNRGEKLYFKYLINAVSTKDEQRDYELLLLELFDKEFISYDEFDDNLIDNSLGLRGRYLSFSATGRKVIEANGGLDFPCTVLEIMVYLATSMEDTIMSNRDFGDRTGLWFWSMIKSLDLIDFDNSRYDEDEIEQKLDIFIERRYQKNGKGGLFTVENHKYDARNTNIWSQMMEFLIEYARENGELF